MLIPHGRVDDTVFAEVPEAVETGNIGFVLFNPGEQIAQGHV